jgi:hypothetical protein
MARIIIEVREGDALAVGADVLALKYAQALFGVDELVVEKLTQAGRKVQFPDPWGFRLETGAPGIAAARILFMGVPRLNEFRYREIRMFARLVLSALATAAPETKHIALTVHGIGYGLDEVEAFEAEIAGFTDAIRSQDIPAALQRITVVEHGARRAKRLQLTLAELVQDGSIETTQEVGKRKTEESVERLRAAGYASNAKPHVFVAMPFKDEMEDVYHYGIQSAVRASGFLCERADLTSFTGDVLDWVRTRIKTSSLVVADLTDANPNIYLEVGFAWGVGVPTVLLVRDVAQLKFDVRGQRCLVYKKIKELEERLTIELKQLTDRSDV